MTRTNGSRNYRGQWFTVLDGDPYPRPDRYAHMKRQENERYWEKQASDKLAYDRRKEWVAAATQKEIDKRNARNQEHEARNQEPWITSEEVMCARKWVAAHE